MLVTRNKYNNKITLYSNRLKFYQLHEGAIGKSYQKFCEDLKQGKWDTEPPKIELYTNFLGTDEVLEIQVLPIN